MGNNTLGYMGTFFSSCLFIPQITHMIKYQSSESISYVFLATSWVTYSIWIGYGITENSNPIILSSAIALFNTFIIAGLKHKFEKNEEPFIDYVVDV